MGKLRPMRPGGPIGPLRKAPLTPLRPQVIAPRPQAILPRPAAPVIQRGANPVRIQAREMRRDTFQQMANQLQNRPRPMVRPAGPPLQVMPKQPIAQAVFRKPVPAPAGPPQAGPVCPTTPPPQASGLRKAVPAQPPMPQQFQGLKSAYHGATQAQPAAGAGVAAAIGTAMLGSLILNSAAANPQISNDVTSLNYSLSDLQNRSSLTQIQAEVTELDAGLNHLTGLLESARNEGYVYQKALDESIYRMMDQWQPIRDQVLQNIPQQAATFQNGLAPLSNQVNRLNSVLGNPTAAMPLLGSTSTQVNSLLNNLSQVEQSLRNSYSQIKSDTDTLTNRLNTVHWMLTQLSEAKFKLETGEDLALAVAARWDQEGDNDPEGILFLTNKRLLFERKEKVATKKVLFITVSQELVQEVLIDQPLSSLQDFKAVNKGLFGHQDFIEIKFADPKLGTVPFHINGQDCKEWVIWLQKAKSGELEKEKVAAGGLSYSDMTGPLTPADLINLQGEVNTLQDTVMLKAVREELAHIENDVRSLERSLDGLRNRGYVIEKSLEMDIAVLGIQWDRIKTNAQTTLDTQTRLLNEQMGNIQKMMANLAAQSANLNAARPLFMQVKSAIASNEAQADAADDTVIAQYDQYADEVESMTAHLEWIGWMLDAIATASFKLLATEGGVAATEAVWERPGLEPENGILFLTDQRLLWEDRVGDFELKLNMPLQQVTDVKNERDETNGQEFLNFSLAAGAPYPTARFRLSLPVSDSWLTMVGRARSGDYAQDRAVPVDQAELERIRNAPRQCSNCGAGLTATILRGQTEITCEYCGQVTRI